MDSGSATEVEEPVVAKVGTRYVLDRSLVALDILDFDEMAGAPSSFDELRRRALVIDLDGIAIPVAQREISVHMGERSPIAHDV